jgi:SAM-dependent methyltransferase
MDDDLFFRLARSEAFEFSSTTKILDFGCGEGGFVNRCLTAGYDAWGCDILIEDEQAHDQARLKAIREPYALPFADDSFDFIVSHQVFEHVQQPEVACREIARVLRPGGLSIHVFPSRYRLIEPHVYVPLATIYHAHWWLALWAKLGVRNEYQKGLTSSETAEHNRVFLSGETNYLTQTEIRDAFETAFTEVRFIEERLMETSQRIPGFLKKSMAPALAWAYCAIYQRIVLAK